LKGRKKGIDPEIPFIRGRWPMIQALMNGIAGYDLHVGTNNVPTLHAPMRLIEVI